MAHASPFETSLETITPKKSQPSKKNVLPNDLTNLLYDLRRRLRRVLEWEAYGRAAVALGLVFWVGLLLDWTFEPAPTIRLIALLLAAFATLIWLACTVIEPLLRPINDRQVAILIEERQPQFEDALITAVDLHQQANGEPSYDPVLLDATTTKARHILQQHGMPQVVNTGRMRLWLAGAVVLAASIVIFFATSTDAFSVYARRLALSPEPWPRRVQLVPEGFTKTEAGSWRRIVAIGQSVDVSVLADLSGDHITPRELKARISQDDSPMLRDSFAKVGQPTTDPDPHQRFRLALGEVHSDITLHVRGGDARLGPLELKVAPRPVVVGADFSITPPEYLATPAFVQSAATVEQIDEGSYVRVTVTSSKPLASAAVGWLEADNVQAAGLRPSPDHSLKPGQREFEINVPPLESDGVLQIELVDTDGIEIAEPHSIPLRVAPDQLPTTSLKLVGVGPFITPDARIGLRVDASDDHALQRGHLQVAIGENQPERIPLSEPIAPLKIAEITQEVDLLTRRFQMPTEQQSLDAANANGRLTPGQTLSISSHVTDAYDLSKSKHSTASPQLRLEIVTLNQLLARIEEREIDLRRTFEQTTADMRGVQRQIDALIAEQSKAAAAQDKQDETPVPEEQPNRLLRLRASDALAEVNQATLAAGAAFRQIHQELIYNRVPNTELIDRIDSSIASPIEDLAATDLTNVAELLQADTISPKVTEIAKRASVRMERILEQMRSLETYNEVLAMLRGLIDEQQRLQRATEKTRREMVRRSLFE